MHEHCIHCLCIGLVDLLVLYCPRFVLEEMKCDEGSVRCSSNIYALSYDLTKIDSVSPRAMTNDWFANISVPAMHLWLMTALTLYHLAEVGL